MNSSPIVRPWLAAAAALVAGPVLAQTEAAPASPPPAVSTPPAAEAPKPPASEAPPAAGEPFTEAPAPAPLPSVPAPAPIEASRLQAPDLFSATPGEPTGLPADLWHGTSADLARTVLPLVAQKSLSPAMANFARRLVRTGARAPDGAGNDAELAADRINAVLALGDIAGAQAMLSHTAGVAASPALSQVAAEAYLILGQDDQACKLADALTQGKDGPYWRRLRAYCLAAAGNADAAQLAYDLADAQAKDDIYKRLMSAAVAGTPPGPASLRNGLDFALSRRLKLDLTPAIDDAWTPVLVTIAADAAYPDALRMAAAQRLKAGAPGQPSPVDGAVLTPLEAGDLKAAEAARVAMIRDDASGDTALELALLDGALRLAESKNDEAVMDQLVERGGAGEAKDRARAQAAAALYAATGAPMSAGARAAFAAFDLGPATGSEARLLELDMASAGGARGDAALLSLWLAADAGASGLRPAERAQIVRGLYKAGFAENARALALEGMIGILSPPPPPPVVKPPPAPKAAKPPPKAPPKRKTRR